jgi:hypothetical protein
MDENDMAELALNQVHYQAFIFAQAQLHGYSLSGIEFGAELECVA